ncbi:serine protease inhibitor Cvsi-1-like isoform X2 [Ruditapes philippinarum]|uniref:serine protease inhibitor Cvsi-1-like isoform X2 n=1 Tax=Ruditapes philippinarum TaxID=129788 RepID=UPI00295ABAFC|nr:serine protease inhibitor Cvsi-1-like isoform X2 [Ruditapes philippinarum]
MYVKIAFLLVVFIGISAAEDCINTDTTTCGHVMCAPGFTPTCDSNICTCITAPDQSACNSLDDCHNYWFGNHCRHNSRHCIDGHCECRRLN